MKEIDIQLIKSSLRTIRYTQEKINDYVIENNKIIYDEVKIIENLLN